MRKCLITGVSGFVGRHLLQYFDITETDITDILGLDYCPGTATFTSQQFSYRFEQVDLTQPELFTEIAKEFNPDWLIHLAAESSVAASLRDPDRCMKNNMGINENILQFLKRRPMYDRSKCKMLAVGSSEVYGYRENWSEPLEESHPKHPSNPYALSRLYQEDWIQLNVRRQNLNIVSTRSFNHTGPGQTDRFVIPSFIRQLLEAQKNGQKTVHLKTGNLDLIRDFSDVRDVVRAYCLLLEHGQSGEVYNVCSGKGIALFEIVKILSEILNLDVTVETDPKLVRHGEPPIVIGSTDKMFRATGWTPQIPLEQTLRDMIQHQKNKE
ncbi:MAG: GDP-mannose 4,6-dehydratase [Planctomycetaceae bacterium]|jgi:GDP-4-dehydro-6-deoxy-D-mannose reductase|nr:GDP-mannose 4,6-dehydratase [Planctomycetaceae bacterium]